MLTTFKSDNTAATSSSVENAFKEIKFLLDLNKKRRADVFLREHLKCLSGHLKNGLADQKAGDQDASRSDSDLSRPNRAERSLSCEELNIDSFNLDVSHAHIKRSLSCEELNSDSFNLDVSNAHIRKSLSCENLDDSDTYITDILGNKRIVENWRNKIKSAGAKTRNRRSNFSILEKHDPDYIQRNIRVLINGYKTGKLKTIHTCAFDSIYSIYGVACVDYDSFAAKYIDSNCEFSQFLKEIAKGRQADEKKCYKIRNEILD